MHPFEKLLRDTLADIAYKDWVFRVEKDAVGLWFLQMQVSGPDLVTQAPIIWSGRKWRLSMHMEKGEILRTALQAVLSAEEHEAREQFHYCGRAVFGPHLNVDRLWEISDDTAHRARS